MSVDNEYITLYLVWDTNDTDTGCYYSNPRDNIPPYLSVYCIGSLETVIEVAEDYYHEHFECDDDYDKDFKINSVEELSEFWEANGYAMKVMEVCKKAIMEA